jgi:hypothetical protein
MLSPRGRGGVGPTHSWPRYQIGWVISITSRPRFTPQLIGQEAGGPQSWSGRSGCRKNSLPLPGIEPQFRGSIHGIWSTESGQTFKLDTVCSEKMFCRRTFRHQKTGVIIIIISHHEFRPGWPVSVSAVISSSSLLSGRPGRRLPFGW